MTSLKKIRLDQFLAENNFVPSRQNAQWLIRSGNVIVNDSIIDKPSALVSPDSNIKIKEKLPYVSRGGLKLIKAITEYRIQIRDKIALDIGSSTGGFTDCLLQNGAAKVYSVDVGYGQLALKLRNDSRVVSMEKTNARFLKKSDFQIIPSIVTIDVSFISLDKILPVVSEIILTGSEVIALIKPQFEAGIKHVKKGVVRDPEVHKQVIEKIIDLAEKSNLKPVREPMESPILGPEGNKEFLLYMRKI
jgi:23S rRNA (cytidine1920-2'-O)/16S rRNA (cytidine1409-2'-O)-methyltransferase